MAINILSTSHSSKQEEEVQEELVVALVVEEEDEEEDYIDLEVSSYSIFHSTSFTSPREFEFHMASASFEREQPSTSPADELFYKGKLLPLHLPPRLQMVENLLDNSNQLDTRGTCEEFYSTPLTTSPSSPVRAYGATPFESCNVSPYGSCAVSRELNPNEYFFESPEYEVSSGNSKVSWGRKIKLIKQSLLGSKLKTPKTYFKSFLGKYSCSNGSCASNIHQASTIKPKNKVSTSTHTSGKSVKTNQDQSSSLDVTRSFHKESEADKGQHHRRRSLSGLSKRPSPNKTENFSSSCSSSSSSSDSSLASTDSNGFNGLRFLKKSNSRKSEMECPIQGAIKHCKQSQHLAKKVAAFPESM